MAGHASRPMERLRLLARSTIVGGDIKWAVNTIDELSAALAEIERVARARHGAELEDAVFAIATIAGSARAKAEA